MLLEWGRTAMEKIRFGIIGAAGIAHKFCDAVKLVKDAEVIAVASHTPGKAAAFAEKNALPAHYESYEQMLMRADIDAVYVATTHNFHKENMLLALQYKKHILCEKAFVLTKADAEEVFAVAKRQGCFVMEAMWTRFLPNYKQAQEWIRSGRLGQIDLANFIIGFKADPNPLGRMRNPELAGGAMFDIGVYAIEIMTGLIPERLESVQSVITRTETGVDKVDCITLRFENTVASLQCVMTCGVNGEMNIYGTDARIHMAPAHCGESAELLNEAGIVEQFYEKLENGFEYEIQECVDCIRAGKLESEIVPHKDTLLCAEIFDTCFAQNEESKR